MFHTLITYAQKRVSLWESVYANGGRSKAFVVEYNAAQGLICSEGAWIHRGGRTWIAEMEMVMQLPAVIE